MIKYMAPTCGSYQWLHVTVTSYAQCARQETFETGKVDYFQCAQNWPVTQEIRNSFNPFAPGNFAKKRVLKLVKQFSDPVTVML